MKKLIFVSLFLSIFNYCIPLSTGKDDPTAPQLELVPFHNLPDQKG